MGRMKEHAMLQGSPIAEPFRAIFDDFFRAQDAMRKLNNEVEAEMNERRAGFNSNTAKGHTNE